MSRAIFLTVLLAVLPLSATAEVTPAPVLPEAPDVTNTIRPTGELTQRQAAPVQERLKSRAIDKPPAVTFPPEAPVVEVNSPLPTSPCAESTGFSYGWLALSFAMLIIGFVAGVVWLRERNRKKLGGMYLRI